MIRLSQLMGQPTISLADAERTGRVTGVQLDGPRVTGVHTGDGVIDATAIRSFEGDAVTYDGVPRLVDDRADSPLGRRVLDEDGDELGHLADLDVEADGTVTNSPARRRPHHRRASLAGRWIVRRHRRRPARHDVDG